jgi:hypothetical protein
LLRSALGAARGRLLRQLLTGSLMLPLLGASAGLLLAWSLVKLVAGAPLVALPGDVREWSLTHKPIPESYQAFDADIYLHMVLHTALQPSSLTAEARQALGEIDASLPLFSVRGHPADPRDRHSYVAGRQPQPHPGQSDAGRRQAGGDRLCGAPRGLTP